MDLFGNEDEDERASRSPPEYGSPEFNQAYNEYIRTPAWRKLRAQVKKRANGRCENTPPGAYHPGRFSVHHLTYERFKHELLGDLQYLCQSCHDLADERRKRETAAKNAAAYEQAGIAAHKASYFRTKYGEDWQHYYNADPEGLEEDYLDWIETKRDQDYE